MKIKKFTAPTMTEALAQVREELGTDAIILSTRTDRRGGVMDFIGRSMVEVTAAIDNDASGERNNDDRGDVQRTPVHPGEARLYPPSQPVAYENIGRKPRPLVPDKVQVRDPGERAELESVLADIRELKQSMKVLADSSLSGDMKGLPPQLQTVMNRMESVGLHDRIAKRLVRQLLDTLTGQELSDPEAIRDKTRELLLAGMGDVRPVTFTGSQPRIVTFVGPTGSGKTTTIAKLAADFTLREKKDVAVLTVDTRRVDAVGQLKAYCRILNVPLHIAYTPEDLPAIMPGLMKSDITLVDTPGSGPMDKGQMMEMVEFLRKLVPQEVHIVISVTTALNEMKRIYDNFSILKPNRILFTKLDETDAYGGLVSFAVLSGKVLSYMTFGQNVPGDFSITDPEKLVRHMLGEHTEFVS